MKSILMAVSALSLAAVAVPAAALGDPEAGRQQAEQQCASCHGPDGNSPTGQFPKLAGQYASYIVRALEDYQSGARQNPIMAGLAAGLSDQDRANLAAYYASQSGLSVVQE